MKSESDNEFRVLVADDDQDAVEALLILLKLEGYRVASCSNGIAAVETEATFAPHVIFLDLEMPGLNGFEVTTEIHRRWHAWQPQIFLVTGVSDVGPFQRVDSPFDAV